MLGGRGREVGWRKKEERGGEREEAGEGKGGEGDEIKGREA